MKKSKVCVLSGFQPLPIHSGAPEFITQTGLCRDSLVCLVISPSFAQMHRIRVEKAVSLYWNLRAIEQLTQLHFKTFIEH
jgi:hypothetical protein